MSRLRAYNTTHSLRRFMHGGIIKMRVTHCGARVRMAKQILGFIKRMAAIYQKTCKAVPQVMDAHIRENALKIRGSAMLDSHCRQKEICWACKGCLDFVLGANYEFSLL